MSNIREPFSIECFRFSQDNIFPKLPFSTIIRGLFSKYKVLGAATVMVKALVVRVGEGLVR